MKTCVVFGGSRGIGLAISSLFVRDAHRVIIVAKSSQNLTAAKEKLETLSLSALELNQDNNGNIATYTCDVTDTNDIHQTIKDIHATHGPIDVLVNSAGIMKDSLLLKSRAADMENVINTNLIGSMLTCQAALRNMIQNKKGCIINVGSVVGAMGNPGQTVYAASKSGLVGFTKSLAKEVATRGIRANVIAPGFINTDMTRQMNSDKWKHAIPLQRFGQPEEVAEAAKFLVNATYITGQVLYVDGGLHGNS